MLNALIEPLVPKNSAEQESSLILLTAAIVVAVHRVVAFPHNWDNIPEQSLHMFLLAFALFGIVPFLVGWKGLSQSPGKMGVCLGDWRLGVKTVAVLFPLAFALLVLPGAHNDEMRHYLPLNAIAGDLPGTYTLLQGTRALLFYTSWEFLFRGFMLFGLEKRIGALPAICVQAIPSSLWHIGMPAAELLSAVPGGVIFGLVALRTRSILWPMLLHFLVAVALDVLIISGF